MTPRATSSNVRAIVDAATMPMIKKAVIRTSIIDLLRSDFRQFLSPRYAAACMLTVNERLRSGGLVEIYPIAPSFFAAQS